MKETFRYGLILMIVCAIASGLLAAVNSWTRPAIKTQLEKEVQNSLKEVFPEAAAFEAVRKDGEILYYKALDAGGAMIGVSFTASQKGYSGTIETMVGMKLDATISAIKVLSHNETPGLGSRIAEVRDDMTVLDALNGKKPAACPKPWFQQLFCGKKVAQLDTIQAITGATVSSRAVIDSVQHKAQEIQAVLKDE